MIGPFEELSLSLALRQLLEFVVTVCILVANSNCASSRSVSSVTADCTRTDFIDDRALFSTISTDTDRTGDALPLEIDTTLGQIFLSDSIRTRSVWLRKRDAVFYIG